MSFAGIGPTGLLLIVVVALLLFGPSKLPELGRAVGRTFKEFKHGAREALDDDRKKDDGVEKSEDTIVKAADTNRKLPD